MTDSIAGLPFWEVTFDADGDPDTRTVDALLTETSGLTDLYVFSHGWNNAHSTARRLYDGFFGLLAQQLRDNPRPGRYGLAGIYWPAELWADEPIPDFTPSPAAPGGGGVAALSPADRATYVADPALDEQTLAGLLDKFPDAKVPLEKIATLLKEQNLTQQTLDELFAALKEFSTQAATGEDDGEGTPGGGGAAGGSAAGGSSAAAGSTGASAAGAGSTGAGSTGAGSTGAGSTGAGSTGAGSTRAPRMLEDTPNDVFGRYLDALTGTGAQIPAGDGMAGIGDRLKRLLTGAKEAARGATYWQMKGRAGVVGRHGLGPLLGRLATQRPDLRVHLIGHSFGARLVSYALDGLPPGPSPVKSVTLLQGAFSHFAFCSPLPFDAGRDGALATRQHRIDGPLTVCFSSHDHAVGRFYPLASLTAGDDTAAAHGPLYRWGGMGADGAQNLDAALDGIKPSGATYRFSKTRILNVDCSEIVRTGDAPSGAHSDIVHPEVTWIVVAASRA